MILAVLGFGHGAHAQTRVALSLYSLDEGKLVYRARRVIAAEGALQRVTTTYTTPAGSPLPRQ